MAANLETPSRLEPCLLEEVTGELLDLLTQLPAEAAALTARLHPRTAANLADLVRVMNCYYSNLIEGHDTHPIDIERALRDDYSQDRKKRDLQIEAKAQRAGKRRDREHEARRARLPHVEELGERGRRLLRAGVLTKRALLVEATALGHRGGGPYSDSRNSV